jgi:preprotein translocase subunit SecY
VLSAFISSLRTVDLRRKILFTLAIVILYRVGASIPSPGVNFPNVQKCVAQVSGGDSAQIYSLINLFSGGALLHLTVFAVGVMPYITASIIVQLLTVVIPRFEELRKEGQSGQNKMTQYTRYLTVALAVLQATSIVALAANGGLLQTCSLRHDIIADHSIFTLVVIVLVMTSGAVLVMWLGEQITERGIGNGMSLLIFAGIVVGLPRGVADLVDKVRTGAWGSFTAIAVIILLAIMVAVVAFIVYVERSERRIPVQYAKRVVGRKIMGGQSTHLPLRVNSGGVMPVIFASSLLTLPQTVGFAFRNNRYFGGLIEALKWGEPLYTLLYVVGIIFFAYFYVSIVFNPNDVADNMRKYGGFIPGIRPGKRTSDHINDILTRITLVGALYLIIISLIPEWMIAGLKLNHLPVWLGGSLFEHLPNWVTNGLNVSFYFGGTSLLIVVGVAMDTVQQIEAQLIMRHYEGFTPRSGRIRGRKW